MNALTRRSLLGGSLALLTSSYWPLSAKPSLIPQIKLPREPMILTRRIERPLSDGNRIVVSRSWEVTFMQSGQGAAVAGHQISAKVDAPARLAPLAQVEEQRSTDGMFPILLSPTGRIVAAGPLSDPQEMAKIVPIAQNMIAHSSRTADEKVAVLRYLSTLQAAGDTLLERLPPDLFFPVPGDLDETHSLALPSGQTGEIELARSSRIANGQRWLERIERKITTRVAGSSQESLEIWSMQPLPNSTQAR